MSRSQQRFHLLIRSTSSLDRLATLDATVRTRGIDWRVVDRFRFRARTVDWVGWVRWAGEWYEYGWLLTAGQLAVRSTAT